MFNYLEQYIKAIKLTKKEQWLMYYYKKVMKKKDTKCK